MNIFTFLFSLLAVLWLLPAVALVVLYLGEARNVPVTARMRRFSDRLLSIFRDLGRVISSKPRRPFIVVAPMDERVLLRSKQGKMFHSCVEPSNSGASAHATQLVSEEDPEHAVRQRNFVSVRTLWKENGEVVAVENWTMGLN